MVDNLAHNGVPGMKWGRGKYAETNHTAEGKKSLSKQDKKRILTVSLAVAAVGVRAGFHFVEAHPEVMTRAANTVKGTKSLTTGYQVVKLASSAVRVSPLGIG